MDRKGNLVMAFCLVFGILGAACASPGKEVDSLEPARWKKDEGVVVVRFITSRAAADDLEHAEPDADVHYRITVGTSKSLLLKAFAQEGSIAVEGEAGPALVVRRLEAGDYYFNEISSGGGSAPLAVRFTVQPGRVTYVGDLSVMFIVDRGFLGLSEQLSCSLKVSADPDSVRGLLGSRYAAVPAMETLPMVIENPSL